MAKREITTKEILWIISCKEFSTNRKEETSIPNKILIKTKTKQIRIMMLLGF